MPIIDPTPIAIGDLGTIQPSVAFPTAVVTCHGLKHSLMDLDLSMVSPGLRVVSCGICGYSYNYDASKLKTSGSSAI